LKVKSKHKLNVAHDTLTMRDFSGCSINEATRSVQSTYGILPTIGNKISGSFRIVRARKINEAVEDITDFRTFGPPPIGETSEGRANVVGYPVLYATTSARTAMREINPNPGDEYFVSIWEKSESVKPLLISLYSLHSNGGTKFDSSGEFVNQWVKDAISFVTTDLKISKAKKHDFLHAMKLRSSLFTMSHYNISSRLAHGLIFDSNVACDAIVYPSIADEGQFCFAVSPDYTYEHMRLVRVYRMVYSEGWIFRSLARGKPAEGNQQMLEWKNTGEYEIDDNERSYW
jgi:hypothetical protein